MRRQYRVGLIAAIASMAFSSASWADGDPQKKAVCDIALNNNLSTCFASFGGQGENYWSCVGNSTSEYGYCLFDAGYREMVTLDPAGG